MCLVCVVSCEKFLYSGAWMPFALGSDCPARPSEAASPGAHGRAGRLGTHMSHSRAMGLLVSIWSGVRRAAAGGAEARVAAKTAGAGAGAPTAAEWDDRAEHDITILLFWCLVAHGHLRRYALARTQPGERRRLDEQQLAADAFLYGGSVPDRHETDRYRQIPERGSNSRQ